MLAAGVSPNAITFYAVFPACGDIGAERRGRELHAHIIKKGIPIDDFLGAALIKMYARTGALDEAAALFSSMRQENPDRCGVSMWNAMIGAYGYHRHITEALELFHQLASPSNEGRVKPNEVTFAAALGACSHGGMVDIALQLIGMMRSRFGITPNAHHHTCVIDALGRAATGGREISSR